MDISYTNLLTIADTLVDNATQALKAAEAIRQHVASEKEMAVRETLGAPQGTDIAPSGPESLRDASPGQRDHIGPSAGGPDCRRVKALGGFPSKLCQDILRAVVTADTKRQGMTADQIGQFLGVPHGAGQILGATSNMVNKMDRRWLRFEGRETGARRWFITDRGREVLALSFKYPSSK